MRCASPGAPFRRDGPRGGRQMERVRLVTVARPRKSRDRGNPLRRPPGSGGAVSTREPSSRVVQRPGTGWRGQHQGAGVLEGHRAASATFPDGRPRRQSLSPAAVRNVIRPWSAWSARFAPRQQYDNREHEPALLRDEDTAPASRGAAPAPTHDWVLLITYLRGGRRPRSAPGCCRCPGQVDGPADRGGGIVPSAVFLNPAWPSGWPRGWSSAGKPGRSGGRRRGGRPDNRSGLGPAAW